MFISCSMYMAQGNTTAVHDQRVIRCTSHCCTHRTWAASATACVLLSHQCWLARSWQWHP
jgi:hypothetical protein